MNPIPYRGGAVMTRRLAATIVACGLLILACLFVTSLQKPTAARAPAAADGDSDVFGLTKVWAIHLTIPAKEYQALQPTGGFPGAPGQPRQNDKDKRARDRNLFGLEFPWVHGD